MNHLSASYCNPLMKYKGTLKRERERERERDSIRVKVKPKKTRNNFFEKKVEQQMSYILYQNRSEVTRM